jgi:3D (Asp-Asp-Asp) domain-containing protein
MKYIIALIIPLAFVSFGGVNEMEVTATYYNATVQQCDSTPLITADGSFIDTVALRNGELRWIAISRDLFKYFDYGDIVIVVSDDMRISGEWIVHDKMNKRLSNRIDFLAPIGVNLGKQELIIRHGGR